MADTNAVLARLQSIYELALEQNQLNTALRAVAMQLKLAEAIPAWRKAARPAQPARAAAMPDFDAILDALEASLPPAGAAAGGSEKPIDATRSQFPEMFSTGSGRAADTPVSARAAPEKPINAKKSQSFDRFSAARDHLPFLPETLTARVALSGGLPGG